MADDIGVERPVRRLRRLLVCRRIHHWKELSRSPRVCLRSPCQCRSRCRPEILSARSETEMTPSKNPQFETILNDQKSERVSSDECQGTKGFPSTLSRRLKQ